MTLLYAPYSINNPRQLSVECVGACETELGALPRVKVFIPFCGFSRSVAQKTTDQANIVAETAVTGANEVAQATVEGVETAVLASGFVATVSDVMCFKFI